MNYEGRSSSKINTNFKNTNVRGETIMAQSVSALAIARYFTETGTHPYDQLTWVTRDSSIVNPGTGKVVFEQKDVEFPEFWSQNAINIVAQKYFYGTPGTPSREKSLRQLIDRVANTVTKYGYENGYFTSEEEADTFNAELKYILATQRAAFNSPVWFNIGTPDRRQQTSACFILKVEDSLTSILNWYREEGMIFKGGEQVPASTSAHCAAAWRHSARVAVERAVQSVLCVEQMRVLVRSPAAARRVVRPRWSYQYRPPRYRRIYLVQGYRGAQSVCAI